MARTIRDSSLESRAARSRLKARGKPYYRAIEEGLHLGYRKSKGRRGSPAVAGRWVLRFYVGGQEYKVETIEPADDFSDADGVAVLSYQQAQERARERMVQRAHAKVGRGGPYTVSNAMDDYFKWLESEGRPEAAIADARTRDRAFIRPLLGDKEVETLTADDFREWRNTLAKLPRRVRTKAGEKQQHREIVVGISKDEQADHRRARQVSTNRMWTTLRAALNRAFENNKVSSDREWRKVRPFQGVDKARVRYLEIAEAQRLVNASDAHFRQMVQAALLTGGRYGQLCNLTVADFNRDAGTIRMSTRKSGGLGKAYYVHLSAEGVSFFTHACSGHAGSEPIFRKSDGTPWGRCDQSRPISEASVQAKIAPPVNFHCLRHTYASLTIMAGAPLLVVAQNLGHSDITMVQQHYGHLSQSYIADQIRKAVPRFGFKSEGNVKVLEGVRR